MLRTAILALLLSSASASKTLKDSAANSDNYCYGYVAGTGGQWCWLTSDGLKDYVKSGDGGWSCHDYNSYYAKDYCEDAQSKSDIVEHASDSHAAVPAAAPAAAPASAPAASAPDAGSASGGCKTTWSCPASWSTGYTDHTDTPDAKAFIAAHNIYRCMHNVQAVLWDEDVYADAKKWSDHQGASMQHSQSGTTYRKSSDGENLAGTFPSSAHRGVDATHMWYSEIADCSYKKSCYQSFSAGHFTAMMWSTINKIAYSDTSKKLAVGRYRGCDGQPPNFNSAYTSHVKVPTKNYGTCLAEVLGCAAFSGLTESDVDGCGASVAANSQDDSGNWVWNTVYKKKCKAKYAGILGELGRLDDATLPEFFRPLAANAWLLGLAGAAAFVSAAALVLRRSRREARQPLPTSEKEEEFLEGSDAEQNLSLE